MIRVILFFAVLIPLSGARLFAQVHIAGNFSISQAAKVAVAGDVLSDADVAGAGILMLNDTGAQLLNCNGHILPGLEVDNPAGVVLAGGVEIGDTLVFTGGKIRLGDYDLTLAAGAAHSGAGTDRYLVTDGTGVVTAAGVAMHRAMVFPVGQSADPGDFTPAKVTNHAVARDISVQVKTYGASQAVVFNAASGVDRAWEISAGAAGEADVELTHIASAEGAEFDNNAAFVTQQLLADGTEWSIGTPAVGNGLAHTGRFTIPAGGPTIYFSKSSNVDSSLGTYIPPPDTPEYVGNISAGNIEVMVTPNPFAQHTYLQITTDRSGESAWQLTDLAGRTLAAGRLQLAPGTSRWRLPVQELTPGTYLLRLSGKGTERQLKLTKW